MKLKKKKGGGIFVELQNSMNYPGIRTGNAEPCYGYFARQQLRPGTIPTSDG